MSRSDECPPWCAEHPFDAHGLIHQLALGDVQLTEVDHGGHRITRLTVRRRPARTPGEGLRLTAHLAFIASQLDGHRALHRRAGQSIAC
jgi:uncharacterized protein YaeQ